MFGVKRRLSIRDGAVYENTSDRFRSRSSALGRVARGTLIGPGEVCLAEDLRVAAIQGVADYGTALDGFYSDRSGRPFWVRRDAPRDGQVTVTWTPLAEWIEAETRGAFTYNARR